MMVEDESQIFFFSNGMVLNLLSNGVISFDSSGQVMDTKYLSKFQFMVISSLHDVNNYVYISMIYRHRFQFGQRLQIQRLRTLERTCWNARQYLIYFIKISLLVTKKA